MKGRSLTTLFATLLITSTCFSQIFTPNMSNPRGTSSKLPQLSSVSGVVIGSDGAPVPDARVELRNENTGNTVASGYTNTNGAFEFANLPSASYEIVATSGLAEARERVGLDGSMGVRIRLRNANPSAAQADGNATVSLAEYRVPQK